MDAAEEEEDPPEVTDHSVPVDQLGAADHLVPVEQLEVGDHSGLAVLLGLAVHLEAEDHLDLVAQLVGEEGAEEGAEQGDDRQGVEEADCSEGVEGAAQSDRDVSAGQEQL